MGGAGGWGRWGKGRGGGRGEVGGDANTDENKNNYYDHNHKPLLVHHLTMEDNGKLYNKNIKRKWNWNRMISLRKTWRGRCKET